MTETDANGGEVPRPARDPARRWWWGGWMLAAAALVGLGAVSMWQRARVGDGPRWDRSRFEVLHETPDRGARETWAVAVNPACPHCLETLDGVKQRIEARSPRPRIAVLIVDTPARPDASFARSLDAEQVWWDSAGVWRRDWLRTSYGEVLCFDGRGDWIRAIARSDLDRVLGPAPDGH